MNYSDTSFFFQGGINQSKKARTANGRISQKTAIKNPSAPNGLILKLVNPKKLFENNPSYPSLNTELLEPKHRLIYSFRLDKKYRAIFICLPEDKVEIIAVTKHYRR